MSGLIITNCDHTSNNELGAGVPVNPIKYSNRSLKSCKCSNRFDVADLNMDNSSTTIIWNGFSWSENAFFTCSNCSGLVVRMVGFVTFRAFSNKASRFFLVNPMLMSTSISYPHFSASRDHVSSATILGATTRIGFVGFSF